MRKQIKLTIKNGRANLTSSVGLKDIISSAEDGNYILTLEDELDMTDVRNIQKVFFDGIDTIVDKTANKKSIIYALVKKELLSDMMKDSRIEDWVDFTKVNKEVEFSGTWLTPLGWREFYRRFKFWAYNYCDCYV